MCWRLRVRCASLAHACAWCARHCGARCSWPAPICRRRASTAHVRPQPGTSYWQCTTAHTGNRTRSVEQPNYCMTTETMSFPTETKSRRRMRHRTKTCRATSDISIHVIFWEEQENCYIQFVSNCFAVIAFVCFFFMYRMAQKNWADLSVNWIGDNCTPSRNDQIKNELKSKG